MMGRVLSAPIYPELLEIGDEELGEIALIMEKCRNVRMGVYKDKCMKRRVAIRMRSCRCNDVSAYCSLLRQSEKELDLLQKTLTIHVSQFFRNPSMFEKLRKDVIPELYRNCAGTGRKLRIWSLGCAGGEEAYSVAILLREHFAGDLKQTVTTIDATDIDADTLQHARAGEFNEDRLKEVPVELLGRYFHFRGSRMQLSDDIREMVTFYQDDITRVDRYQPRDLVLCRNTLIYFNRTDQEGILHGIADVLPPGGVLVLGKSETLVGEVRRRFTAICPVERIYRRI